jgi:hypothetical protein
LCSTTTPGAGHDLRGRIDGAAVAQRADGAGAHALHPQLLGGGALFRFGDSQFAFPLLQFGRADHVGRQQLPGAFDIALVQPGAGIGAQVAELRGAELGAVELGQQVARLHALATGHVQLGHTAGNVGADARHAILVEVDMAGNALGVADRRGRHRLDHQLALHLGAGRHQGRVLALRLGILGCRGLCCVRVL